MIRETDEHWMELALELALQGQGHVEPNPMVGCVLVRDGVEIGRGYHDRFGGPHAEINALRTSNNASGATAYVTLEPCCHVGKTGKCTDALIAAGIRRVVAAVPDLFPAVAGKGFQALRDAGIEVQVGVLESKAVQLNAPYLKRLKTGRPWVIGKWAMTLDGKIATAQGDSRWISNSTSREFVHRLRGRVDAILIGLQTALRDRPLLTARPAGPRVATRVIFDRRLDLPLDSPLVLSTETAPVLIISNGGSPERRRALEAQRCEVLDAAGSAHGEIEFCLIELGRRNMTNVLVEGGGQLLGSFLDAGQIDEVYAFVAPKLVGGEKAISPISGHGVSRMADAVSLFDLKCVSLDNDICLHGRIQRNAAD